MITPFRPRRDRRPPLSLTKPPGCMYSPRPVVRAARRRHWLRVQTSRGHVLWVAQADLDAVTIDRVRLAADKAYARGMEAPLAALVDDDHIVVLTVRW